jgi:hypothetical protein
MVAVTCTASNSVDGASETLTAKAVYNVTGEYYNLYLLLRVHKALIPLIRFVVDLLQSWPTFIDL